MTSVGGERAGGRGPPVTTGVRLGLATLVAAHAGLHLLGAAEGLGWATVPQPEQVIGVGAGWAWLAAAVAMAGAAGVVAVGARWWWAVAALAAVTSQAVVLMSWQDAKAGTVVNVLLLVAAVSGCATSGPGSFDAQWQQRAGTALAAAPAPEMPVSEADLAALPDPLAAYLRQAGVVGEPRPHSLLATFSGRIRSGADQPWMPFTGRQVSTFGHSPTRLFLLHATRAGLPVTVLHVFDQGRATMRGKLLSVIPVLDASGPEMDRGETVTVFNDMVVLAPAALVSARVAWTSLSDRAVLGTFTNGTQVVSATLHFNAENELTDFVSDDRLRASRDGTAFTPQTWSTPVQAYAWFDGHRLPAEAVARGTPPNPKASSPTLSSSSRPSAMTRSPPRTRALRRRDRCHSAGEHRPGTSINTVAARDTKKGPPRPGRPL